MRSTANEKTGRTKSWRCITVSVGAGHQYEGIEVDKQLDKRDVSEIIKMSIRTVDRLRKSGELKSYRVRGLVRFSPEDVQDFIDAKRNGMAGE
jgi:excisionase family DNA binding protein